MWTICGIGGTLVLGFLWGMVDGSVASGFNAAAWTFTVYMLLKLAFSISQKIPEANSYKEPAFEESLPETIDRKHLPVLEGLYPNSGSAKVAVHRLVGAVLIKIMHAADETAIHHFVTANLSLMRRQINERYSGINGEINTLAFEGAIGTILGMMTFLAQSVVLFKLPPIGGEGFDAVKFAQLIVANLDKINLYTVMTAFITSLIGWGAKGWLGRYIDDRRGREMESLSQVESWLLDTVIARLHLPSQVSTFLTLEATSSLAKPLVDAMAVMKTTADEMQAAVSASSDVARAIADDLAPMIQGLTLGLSSLENVTVEMQHVQGGYRIVLHSSVPEGKAVTHGG